MTRFRMFGVGKAVYFVPALLWLLACKSVTGESPLVGLANRLYLAGEWSWTDSMRYQSYYVEGDPLPHRGWYIVTGTATIDDLDSSETERYALTATASLFHVDSVAETEVERWTVSEIEFIDTIEVRNDTVFGLSVEPIPPLARPTTNGVSWTLSAEQLWCTNWLTETEPPGNGSDCYTTIWWARATVQSDSSSSGGS
ncbi:MAG: hypothetical protein IID05_03435 [Gemmatimonadetes bacterium]|nr:hypothetical protein [Gemmatimonadota bacterium]